MDGVPLDQISLRTLRRAIAVVPQDTVLFNNSLAYNIGIGMPGSPQEEIEAAARLAHLDQLIAHLPEGYATRVGERGVKLSGGERQRVSIARAALKRPRIYVFDEATSSLDSRTEQEILQNLQEIASHCTTVVIAHRLSTVVHADQIIVLDAGRILERGTHEELLNANGRYRKLWDAQHAKPSATESVALN
jgi:ATP-binding cassette, subfamily B, heavy metal transporter